MLFLRWTMVGVLLAALGVGTSAQWGVVPEIDAGKGRPEGWPAHQVTTKLQLSPFPYEVVPDHFKPTFPEGWTWGGVTGVYAESPDRVYVYGWNGLMPKLPRFLGPDGLLPARDATFGGVETRREYFLTVFDRNGNRIEHWKNVDEMMAKPGHSGHRIKVNPWDPDKHVWLVDEGAQGGILKMTRDGKLVMKIGAEKGIGCQRPQDIAFTPNGDFWCAEGFEIAHLIKFSKDGKRLMEVGTSGRGPGEMFHPHAIAIDRRGRIYVGDRGNYEIDVFDQNGKFLESWPDVYAGSMAIDKNDHLWTMCTITYCGTDKAPHGMSVHETLNGGKMLFTWGVAGGLPNQLYGVSQFDVDREGNLYTVSVRDGRVEKFRPKRGADRNHLIAWPLDMREK